MWNIHSHDSLLENQVNENLTEEQRQRALDEFGQGEARMNPPREDEIPIHDYEYEPFKDWIDLYLEMTKESTNGEISTTEAAEADETKESSTDADSALDIYPESEDEEDQMECKDSLPEKAIITLDEDEDENDPDFDEDELIAMTAAAWCCRG